MTRTHGEAFPRVAWLASDANPDRRAREAYARLATQPYIPPAPSNTEQGGQAVDVEDRPTAAESLAILKVARECPHRSVPSCSCVFAICRKDGRDKSAAQCMACIQDQRRPPDEPASPPPAPVFDHAGPTMEHRS